MGIGAGNASGQSDAIRLCLDHAGQFGVGNVGFDKSNDVTIGAVGALVHLELSMVGKLVCNSFDIVIIDV